MSRFGLDCLTDQFDQWERNLSLAELVSFYCHVEHVLNGYLDLQPISDTLDLRSSNIRTESYTGASPELSLKLKEKDNGE